MNNEWSMLVNATMAARCLVCLLLLLLLLLCGHGCEKIIDAVECCRLLRWLNAGCWGRRFAMNGKESPCRWTDTDALDCLTRLDFSLPRGI